MFYIRFTDEEATNLDNLQHQLAEICIGDFVETIQVPTGFWTKKQYEIQWRDAIESIVNSMQPKSALFTEVADPKAPQSSLDYWALYSSGNSILIQNFVHQLNESDEATTFDELYSLVPDYLSADGASEWSTTKGELDVFLQSLKL